MKADKIFIFCLLLLIFILSSGQAFAGTGNANDGQVMLLAILAFLFVVFGILNFFPWLVHQIRNLWNRYRHC